MPTIFRRKQFRLRLPSRTLLLGERTFVMGALNVTPDSFSDGGLFLNPDAAIERAFEMEREGADIIDVGGESTRPGSEGIPADEELRRILPVLNGLRGKIQIPISVDTSKSEVAEQAAKAGAEILNDVTALRNDPRMAEVARKHKLALILMHMRGAPDTMQKKSFARNILKEVMGALRHAASVAERAGISRSHILVDPGIGFGKNDEQNYELIARLPDLANLGFAIVIGTSRKGFLGRTLGGASAGGRLMGTAATTTASILAGAHVVRVHDVKEIVQLVRVTDRVLDPHVAKSAPGVS